MMEDNKDSADKQRTHGQSKEIKTTMQLRTLIREMPNLPQDVIAEILVRLPVKSLLKFRCVSKSWLSLISSPDFIKTHLEYSTLDPTFASHRLVLSTSKDPLRVKLCSLSSVFRNLLTDEVEAEFPNTQTNGVFNIAGYCNGLLCVWVYESVHGRTNIFLWNPSLRISKKLPPVSAKPRHPQSYYIYVIGYDESNDDYKVVRLFRCFAEMVEIYSLKNDSWKRIEGFGGCIQRGSSSAIYANGKFHFPAYFASNRSKWNIVSLDIENEVYGTVELPEVEQSKDDNYCSGIFIGVLKGCISALYNYDYERGYADVWVLKELGVKESWTKLVSIPCHNRPSRDYMYPYRSCILLNGKYLLCCGGLLVVYDPEDNSFLYPQGSNMDEINYNGIYYVESLVPLSR